MRIAENDIAKILSALIQNPEGNIPFDQPLAEIGCDSITAMKLQMELMKTYRIRVTMEELQDSTVHSVTELVNGKLAQKG